MEDNNQPASLQSSKPSAQILSGLSGVLRSLLQDAPNSHEAISQIGSDRALKAEVTAALPALWSYAVHPAGEEGVRRVIAKRFALYPQAERLDGEWNEWWADYFAVLHDLPEPALEAGMAKWIRDPESRFLPMPGQLRQLALNTPNRASSMYERAKSASQYEPKPVYEEGHKIEAPKIREIPEPSPEDKALVRKMAAEYAKMNAPKPKPEDNRPGAVPANVDEFGITPELRAILQRREEGSMF